MLLNEELHNLYGYSLTSTGRTTVTKQWQKLEHDKNIDIYSGKLEGKWPHGSPLK